MAKSPFYKKFGVMVPLWRAPVHERRPITLEFILQGKIPSKKNRQKPAIRFATPLRNAQKFTQDNPSPTGKQVYAHVRQMLKDIHPFIYKPQEIKDWEETAKTELIRQLAYWRERYAVHKLGMPIYRCSISIKYHWKDDYRRDNINRDQTIHDILVDAKIIADDTYQCLFKTTSEAANYADLIPDHITVIHITAYDWLEA